MLRLLRNFRITNVGARNMLASLSQAITSLHLSRECVHVVCVFVFISWFYDGRRRSAPANEHVMKVCKIISFFYEAPQEIGEANVKKAPQIDASCSNRVSIDRRRD